MDAMHSIDQKKPSVLIARLLMYYVSMLAALVVFTFGTHFEEWMWRVERWVQTLSPQWLSLYNIIDDILPLAILVGYLGFLLPRVAKVMIVPRFRRVLCISYILILYVGYAVAYGLGVLGIVGWGRFSYVISDTVASWYSFLYILGFFVLLPGTIIALGMRLLQRTRTKKVEGIE